LSWLRARLKDSKGPVRCDALIVGGSSKARGMLDVMPAPHVAESHFKQSRRRQRRASLRRRYASPLSWLFGGQTPCRSWLSGKGSNPQLILKHLPKCFDNITSRSWLSGMVVAIGCADKPVPRQYPSSCLLHHLTSQHDGGLGPGKVHGASLYAHLLVSGKDQHDYADVQSC